jgi:DNA-binding beta-propeller fold protein YncE
VNLDDPRSPLHLVRKIELPNVKGRIDHMALDSSGGHLFVAEYGNGSVDDVDLASGKVAGRITALKEPQGVAWLPAVGQLAVASGDGVVTFYRGADRQKVAAVRLGDDADNLRVDSQTGNLVVGYGSGALAVIDPAAHRVTRQLPLPAHPEAFEIVGTSVFVNVPNANKIVVGNLALGRVTRSISTGSLFGNYPMASDPARSRIAVAYRRPGTLSVIDSRSGAAGFPVSICGDADDLYFHAGHVLVVCGTGAIEYVDEKNGHSVLRIRTQEGARTGLLDAVRGRLFVAVPARSGSAFVWELSVH